MEDFDSKFYMATLKTADQCGLSIIPRYKAAQLFAIIYVWGGGNEGIVLSPKVKVEVDFIKEKYHIDGGEIPDAEFVVELQKYIKEYEGYVNDNSKGKGKSSIPEHVQEFMRERYNLKLEG